MKKVKNFSFILLFVCLFFFHYGRNIVVPVTWPTDSSAGAEVSRANADYVRFLESQLASLTMKDGPGSSINNK